MAMMANAWGCCRTEVVLRWDDDDSNGDVPWDKLAGGGGLALLAAMSSLAAAGVQQGVRMTTTPTSCPTSIRGGLSYLSNGAMATNVLICLCIGLNVLCNSRSAVGLYSSSWTRGCRKQRRQTIVWRGGEGGGQGGHIRSTVRAKASTWRDDYHKDNDYNNDNNEDLE